MSFSTLGLLKPEKWRHFSDLSVTTIAQKEDKICTFNRQFQQTPQYVGAYDRTQKPTRRKGAKNKPQSASEDCLL